MHSPTNSSSNIRIVISHKEKNHQGSLTSSDQVSEGRIVDDFQVTVFTLYTSSKTKNRREDTIVRAGVNGQRLLHMV